MDWWRKKGPACAGPFLSALDLFRRRGVLRLVA
jgi:hypothetical protein